MVVWKGFVNVIVERTASRRTWLWLTLVIVSLTLLRVLLEGAGVANFVRRNQADFLWRGFASQVLWIHLPWIVCAPLIAFVVSRWRLSAPTIRRHLAIHAIFLLLFPLVLASTDRIAYPFWMEWGSAQVEPHVTGPVLVSSGGSDEWAAVDPAAVAAFPMPRSLTILERTKTM